MGGPEAMLVSELAVLRDAGYHVDFAAVAGGLRCGYCEHVHDPESVTIDRHVRFEGVSDPDDQAILLALTCQECGSRGVLVAPYGPAASAEEAAVLVRLHDTGDSTADSTGDSTAGSTADQR